jgi:bifunctional non-homologous end joining protein LigD
MHVRDSGAVKLLMKSVPVYYIIFDLLYLDNQITMPLPFKQRREMLEGLLLSGPSWRTSPAIEGEGKSMYETAEAHAMEGIVAKKLDSPYDPGRRSPNWLKIKIIQSQELVVGGWCPEKGDNRARIGCLLLGYYDKGQFRYAGSVGSGYTDATHGQLVEKLRKIERPTSPFVDKVPKPNAIFVDPNLVVEVDYRRWPEGGLVQQASYKGLRMDKKASQVVKEERIPASELAAASGKAQMR